MKRICLFTVFCLLITASLFAQLPGDTIIVNSFNYSQKYKVGERDTMVQFPNLPGITYQKILMTYNMRCKNGVVGSSVTPQAANGCGEWDYSCNTYLTDSTKTDSVKAKSPSHIITNFNGTTFNYTTIPTYTFFNYKQHQTYYTSTISQSLATIGIGASASNNVLHTQLKNGKSQFLWTAAELAIAGLTAGNITGLQLDISNVGSAAQFLKIKMKHSTQTSLSASTPDLTGFTEVYFSNTPLIAGINQFNFYNNFNWNGLDNILVEFSFSNSNTGTDNIVTSDTNTATLGLVTTIEDYNFEFDGTNKINVGNSNFASIANELSICFWAKGNEKYLPANTAIMEAFSNSNIREVNIHFPWSNSNIYWDCGNAINGYDRINQLATNNQIKGVWNHWAFTKNKVTGVMNVYLNGNLWLTGTGKTIPIAFTNLVLGIGANNNYPYFGQIDDLSIWNKELSLATIKSWMSRNITNAHPNFANLKAYYAFNEGAGTICADAAPSPSSANVVGNSLWQSIKGNSVFKNFEETNNRPKVSFIKGVYTQTDTIINIVDSIQNSASIVKAYAVNNNTYNLVSTNSYYPSGYSYIFDGDSLVLIDSVIVPATGTINITQLNHVVRTPAKYQIMSFVTPYGNNLDLGIKGKTYTFDVTDFEPILKGTKRITMDAGGQWQEDMDIKFLFIVGTPPRATKSITNLWRVDAIDYTNILNDNYFEPRTLNMDPTGKTFKVRTVISGHGQEGEFIPRVHLFNIDGGTNEFNWQVAKACAENPLYPQGGTWVYDRAGWCPGMATDLQEHDITPFVTPGANAILDYNITTASGDSRYWISNQLVTYGAPNFNLDATIVDVKNPSKKVEYARSNAICGSPVVTIRNTGSTALTSVIIDYWVNNSTTKDSFKWTGNLAFMQTTDIILPFSSNLWAGITSTTGNVFHATIRNPNNGVDEYALNNFFHSEFDLPNVVPSKFIIWFKTNNIPAENSYEIKDGLGNTIFTKNNLAANIVYKDTFELNSGCYQLLINDIGEDGLNWWANPNQGAGYCTIKKMTGSNVKALNPDFGKSIIYNFTIDYPLAYEDILKENSIDVYPNPAQLQFTLEGNIQNKTISLYNTYGSIVTPSYNKQNNKIVFDSSNLPKGVYFILVTDKAGKQENYKILID